MNEEFYKRQLNGLILVMEQNATGNGMIARSYVIEKLNMILNGGMGFHPSIEKKLK